MEGKMRGVTLFADWDPRPDFVLGPKDIEGKQTYLGSRVWRNPRVKIEDVEIPQPNLPINKYKTGRTSWGELK